MTDEPIPRGSLLTYDDVVDGRFAVLGLLGSSRSAAVYRVKDIELGGEVALKLLAHGDSDEEAVERFRREMRICRSLDHPNIVRSYEFGLWRGRYFLTMELLTGDDLLQVVRRYARKGLPVGDVVSLIRQAAAALALAHERGIVHRDIKPENLFLMADSSAGAPTQAVDDVGLPPDPETTFTPGMALPPLEDERPLGLRTLKVMDFGIARLVDAEMSITSYGTLLGSPGYIAPEMVRGERATFSADLHALGVVAWELLSGRRLYAAQLPTDTLMKVVKEGAPLLRTVREDVPEALEALVASMLRKHPENRVGSATEIVARLTALG